jgi:hypothetical protein
MMPRIRSFDPSTSLAPRLITGRPGVHQEGPLRKALNLEIPASILACATTWSNSSPMSPFGTGELEGIVRAEPAQSDELE